MVVTQVLIIIFLDQRLKERDKQIRLSLFPTLSPHYFSFVEIGRFFLFFVGSKESKNLAIDLKTKLPYLRYQEVVYGERGREIRAYKIKHYFTTT